METVGLICVGVGGQGKCLPVEEILGKIQKKVGKVIALRANDLAKEAGNPLSPDMLMLGALKREVGRPGQTSSSRTGPSVFRRSTSLMSSSASPRRPTTGSQERPAPVVYC